MWNLYNFWPWISQPWVTNINEYNPLTKKSVNIFTKPQEKVVEKPSLLNKVTNTIIPTVNANNEEKDLLQQYLEDPKKDIESKKEVMRALKDGVEPEELIWHLNKIWYKGIQPTDQPKEEQPWLMTKLWQRATNIWEQFTRETSKNPITSSLQNLGASVWIAWNLIWWVGDIIWEWVSYITPDIVKDTLKWWAKKTWDNTPEVVKQTAISAIKTGWEEYKQFKQNNPFLADTLEWGLNIVSLAPIWKGGQLVKQWLEKTWEWLIKWWKLIKWWSKELLVKWANLWDKTTDLIANKIIWSSDGSKELFKATSPSYNTFSKSKDIYGLADKSKLADKTVLEYWFEPTNTTERVKAYKDTMGKVWQEVEKERWEVTEKINWWDLATQINNFIEGKKINWKFLSKEKWDIEALQTLAEDIKEMWEMDLNSLWNLKVRLNSDIDYWDKTVYWHLYNTWLKDIIRTIWEKENNIFEKVASIWTSENLKKYWALRSMYDDIVKQDINQLRKKGLSIEETYSKFEGLQDLVKWTKNFSTSEIWTWVWKILLWKSFAKLKDKDFLIKEWYKKMKKSLNK